METERWQRTVQIFHSARELAAEQRKAFLRQACAGDETLLREVQRMLAEETGSRNPLETPALEHAARALADEERQDPQPDLSGRTLSHYRILEKIGEGGMGIVFRAHDTLLDRDVAIKLLPAEWAADPDHRKRFVREAQAASALNHPHIVTIHEISSDSGMDFIVMEYIAGHSLDRKIGDREIPLSLAMKYAIQIADAFAAAHTAGIVHRDLKPANIMITETGQVKVLDFGLVKRAIPMTDRESGSAPVMKSLTGDGRIVGTVAYMSPEQAEGNPVDARSDIFSFGSVLYEIVSGRRAFPGNSSLSTLSAILRSEPAPFDRGTARPLQAAIRRCLQKDPARRFQSMAEVKAALEGMIGETGADRAAARRRGRMLSWTAGAFLLALASGISAWRILLDPPASQPPRVGAFASLQGLETNPALSPDGKQVAFVWNSEKQDNSDIYLQLVGEATARRLTSDPGYDFSPVWSPDALYVAFLRATDTGNEVRIVPAAGGAEQRLHITTVRCRFLMRIMSRQFCGIAWSPDGKALSIVDRDSPESPPSIFLLDIATREKKKLTSPPAAMRDGISAFSPDGQTLAFARGFSAGFPSDIYTLALTEGGAAQGAPNRITRDNMIICGLDWTADGRSIVYSSNRGGLWGLWRAPISGRESVRLAVGSENAAWPSVSRRGNKLAFARGEHNISIWQVAPPGTPISANPAGPSRVIYADMFNVCPAYSPDGRQIAFSSNRTGTHQIWISNSDGTNQRQLTHFDIGGALQPRWSPDGRTIAFWAEQKGHHRISLMDAEGGKERPLTTDDYDKGYPGWSRDGKWVYFFANRGNGGRLWKKSVEEDILLPVTSQGGFPAFESTDGRTVYYGNEDGRIFKVPVSGGEETPALTVGRGATWTLGESRIYVLDPFAKGGPAIETYSLSGGKLPGRVALPGDPDHYFWNSAGTMSISPDGRWILYEHSDRIDSDILLAENFR